MRCESTAVRIQDHVATTGRERHFIRRAIDKSFVSGFRCVMAIGAALAVANAVTGVVWIQRERG